MTDPVRGWAADLMLGARLALGGHRSGWLRMALTGAGIGVAVAVLLLAASIGPVRAAQQQREDATSWPYGPPPPGSDPLYLQDVSDPYRGYAIDLVHVRAGGPRAAVPAGLERLPGPGEQVVSPALAALLASPEGDLLRARYPARTIGTIGPAGLPGGPRDLLVYAGSADLAAPSVTLFRSGPPAPAPLPPVLWVLLVVGVVAVLFPVVVLVAVLTRLSAAERQRRLAAVRLVGAGAGQVRRIAAGEALAGALLGLLVGAGLFLGARLLVERDAFGGVADFAGVRPFAADVVPSGPLVVLIALLVPGLAVVTATAALRRTLIEPLGVVRQAAPPRRRVLWRLLPAVAGVALLSRASAWPGSDGAPSGPVLVAGAVLLLTAVPAVLPWLVQQVVRRPWDGTPALQLASRRLQLDSGPPARLVAGIAVTLAGAIGLGALLLAAESRYSPQWRPPPLDHAEVALRPPVDAAALAGRLRAVPGVREVAEVRVFSLDTGITVHPVTVAPCATLRRLAGLPSCVDGRMYGSPETRDEAGRTFRVLGPEGDATPYELRLPARLEVATPGPETAYGALFATPAAVRSVPAAQSRPVLRLTLDPARPGTVEEVRNALVPAGWRADLSTRFTLTAQARDVRDFTALRAALAAGAALTLTLAALALLAMCVQQVRDARRPLAALAAAGVPRAVLARSLVWQNAILGVAAVLVADVAGVTLGLLLLPAAGALPAVDLTTVAALSAVALGTVAGATALTLPAVRAATRPSGLRTE